ncbi:DUF6520 family protein [Luteirhabdus pelagi]|uniref:DUF6520 family protein n=1 Tax=Luteirhabdus pelagi TaxID=2792783 RepID=UPI00193A9854|nr:DUF6520 family protein [Luteirhabdus pelagi]
MKTRKLKFMIPLLAIVFAVTSAFTTADTSKVESASILGYLDAPSPCMQSVSCLPSGTVVCTNARGAQAYGKFHPNDTTCPREVYKN